MNRPEIEKKLVKITVVASPFLASLVLTLSNSPDVRCCYGVAPLASLVLWACVVGQENSSEPEKK